MTEKENEAFLRQMRHMGVKGEDGSVGLDRVYLLLDVLDAERARMDMMVQSMESILSESTDGSKFAYDNLVQIRATARVALEDLKEATKMTLKVGDTLKDNDPRTNGATVTVQEIGITHVFCKRGPRRVAIAISRVFDDGKVRRSGFTVMPPASEE